MDRRDWENRHHYGSVPVGGTLSDATYGTPDASMAHLWLLEATTQWVSHL